MTIKDIDDATMRMWHAVETLRGLIEEVQRGVSDMKRQNKESDVIFGVRHNLGLPEGTPDKDLPGAVHKLRCDIWNLEKKLETANAALTAERSTILKIRETLGCQ